MENLELKVVSNIDTSKVENSLIQEKKVTEEEVEKSLNYNELPEEEKKAIDEFVAKIDPKNTTEILQYGSSAQNNISKFSDSVLDNVKTRSTGEVGDLLSDLVVEIKQFDSDIPRKEYTGIAKIFHSATIIFIYNCRRKKNTRIKRNSFTRITKNCTRKQ